MAMLRDEALILRRSRFSESSLVVTLFTRTRGRVDVLAKGCLREKSPLFGHLDHCQREDVLVYERQRSGLDLLTEAFFVDEHIGLRLFPAALAAACLLGELLLFGCMPGDPHPELFDRTAAAFRRLADFGEPWRRGGGPGGEGADGILAVSCRELMASLSLLGFGLELGRCVECGRVDLRSGTAVSRIAGGVVCPDCAPGAGASSGISMRELTVLREFAERDERPAPPRRRESLGCLRILAGYAQHVLERPLAGWKPFLQLLPPVPGVAEKGIHR